MLLDKAYSVAKV